MPYPPIHQVSPGTIQTKVPFDFVANDTRLPAGDYKFEFDTLNRRMNITDVATNQRISVIVRDIVDKSVPPDRRLVSLQKGNDHVVYRVSGQTGWDMLMTSCTEDSRKI